MQAITVCTACNLRGTNRGPQIVHSDLQQRRSYGSLLTRGAECKSARSINLQAQGVCFAYTPRGTKVQLEIVNSSLEQRCSYGPLLTSAMETERAGSIEIDSQCYCYGHKSGWNPLLLVRIIMTRTERLLQLQQMHLMKRTRLD